MQKKVKVSYMEFMVVKNGYLKDIHPLKSFGQEVSESLGINNERLINHQGSVTEVRVLLDSLVDWIS